MDTGLAGKRCLITGGNSGIGLGIAKVLACEGVRLVIASRDDYPEAIEELRALGAVLHFLKVDVSTESAVVGMVRQAIGAWDGLDLFVNNAAAAWHEPVTRVTGEAFQQTIDTNLASCLWACREIAGHMIARRSGSILIIGSTASVCPAYGEASYRISKMGLKMYMETLAIELAQFGIRVNMLTPGHFPTRLTAKVSPDRERLLKREIPQRRFGSPAECGYAAAFLLSDQLSSYTTGAELFIDGGLSLRPLPLLGEQEISVLNQ